MFKTLSKVFQYENIFTNHDSKPNYLTATITLSPFQVLIYTVQKAF
uniref:Uncharacterized protein n=1 Tax=Anguilla anguilla TaxID=7936 RepID=A0A0E9WKB2_ANGAN